MTLTTEYQYIGRSSPVSTPSGYKYYLLVYANAQVDAAKGTYRVGIKSRLACNVDASFYAFTTTGYARAEGVTAYEWKKQQIPYDYWGDSASITEGGETYRRWTELKAGTAEIPGSYGGNKEIQITAGWVMNSSSSQGWFPNTGEEALFSATVTLEGIGGDASFTLTGSGKTSAGNPFVDAGGKLKLTVSTGTSFQYKAEYLFGSEVLATEDTITGSREITVDPSVWLPKFTDRANTENLSDGVAPSVRVTAFSGSTQAGTPSVMRFDIRVPNEYSPSLTVTELSPVSDLPSSVAGLYLQSRSRVKAVFTAAGQYGASIATSVMEVDGESYDEADGYTSEFLSVYGEKTVKITATDSRGLTTSYSGKIQVIAYTKPKVEVLLCARCDEYGVPSETGAYLKIHASRTYSKVMHGGEQLNRCTIRYRWKSETSDWSGWEAILPGADLSTNSVETAPLLGTLDPKAAYAVQIGVSDDLGGTNEVTYGIGGEEVYMHRTKDAMGLGKYVQGQRLLDCAWDAWFRGRVLIGEDGITLEEYIQNLISGGM